MYEKMRTKFAEQKNEFNSIKIFFKMPSTT